MTDDLSELGALLDSGKIQVLRDRFAARRQVRQELQAYTSAVYLFPFGMTPDPNSVQVFRNGIAVWMGEEAKLVPVGEKPTLVVVLEPPAREGDIVQATFVAVPEEKQ